MTLLRLMLLVIALLGAIALAFTNPTTDDYLRFLDRELAQALDKMDRQTPTREQQFIRQVFRAQSKQLLETVVRPQTTRGNWGLFSRFETRIAETEVVVLGLAGRFIPVHGLEEATLKIGRLAF
ncbi:DUF4359 domain-containing protein [Nitrospira moscoviensis]|uniref:DUF4359 domain-containing protein n=1 Tax=Nitrospira moscoviensis TaxID=42253 RepID=A0A0K2GCN4_NITMO|nr:DUF4359 domain-containing protein [Nitrospira moscoviensis]ALA58721.1 conserved exported protein of unknown function [Nitrospira moscoviensis]